MRPGTESACRVQRRLRLVEPSAPASRARPETRYQLVPVAFGAGRFDTAIGFHVAPPSVDQSSARFMFVAGDSL